VSHARTLPGEKPITIDAPRWQDALPAGAWPAGFAETGSATRADVFEVAARWQDSSASAMQLAAASLAWGYGVRGYGRYRTRRVLAQDSAGALLAGALENLRPAEVTPDALIDAYDRFRSAHRLHGLGPAFFTKILYFAGYRHERAALQPLILDSVVAGRLPAEAGPANQYRYGWSSSTWHGYLRWAHEQAARPEFGNQPDHVELSLFAGSWIP